MVPSPLSGCGALRAQRALTRPHQLATTPVITLGRIRSEDARTSWPPRVRIHPKETKWTGYLYTAQSIEGLGDRRLDPVYVGPPLPGGLIPDDILFRSLTTASAN